MGSKGDDARGDGMDAGSEASVMLAGGRSAEPDTDESDTDDEPRPAVCCMCE